MNTSAGFRFLNALQCPDQRSVRIRWGEPQVCVSSQPAWICCVLCHGSAQRASAQCHGMPLIPVATDMIVMHSCWCWCVSSVRSTLSCLCCAIATHRCATRRAPRCHGAAMCHRYTRDGLSKGLSRQARLHQCGYTKSSKGGAEHSNPCRCPKPKCCMQGMLRHRVYS
jgi:hypothetical protein